MGCTKTTKNVRIKDSIADTVHTTAHQNITASLFFRARSSYALLAALSRQPFSIESSTDLIISSSSLNTIPDNQLVITV